MQVTLPPQAPAATSPPASDIVRFGGGFILVCLALVSLAGVGATVADLVHYAKVDSWVQTTARVTRATVEPASSNESSRGTPKYRPIAAISYAFEGETLTEARFELAPITSREQAGQLAKAHPADTEITIFVDPEHPDRITIDNDPPPITGASLGMLLPSIAYWVYFGGWLIPAMLRKRRAARAAR